MNNQLSIKDELTDFLLYTVPNGKVKVEVILNNETVWLTQKAIAALFNVNVPAISKHLKNIFESGELEEISVVSILETTATDGKKYQVQYYNLDAIISVGSFFDYIERIIETRNTFTMEQFALSVNKFLEFNEYKVLEGKGMVSAKQAEEKAFAEYDKFNKSQKIESDFDKAIKSLQQKKL